MHSAEPHEPKPHPYKAEDRHHIWSVDLRSIEKHRLGDDKPVYIISILDNFSRTNRHNFRCGQLEKSHGKRLIRETPDARRRKERVRADTKQQLLFE